MYETLSEQLAPEFTEKPSPPSSEQDSGGGTETDSFLDLLADAERHAITGNRGDVIARYRAWIERNSPASAALYGAWFNLGVELAAAEDKAGAIDAYQNALTLRPGFYPAAINLGTILEAAGQPESALAIWQQALQPAEARAALLDHRNRLAEARRIEQRDAVKVVLHICHAHDQENPPPVFRNAGWREIRRDLDPTVRSDFVAGLTDMRAVSDGEVDAVYSPHAINHLRPHEVPLALQEMHRVLKPAGFALLTLPDLQEVARYIAAGKLEDPVCTSPGGPITPLGILYGHLPSVANGHAYATPYTGFTSATLAAKLIKAGFAAVMVQREPSACVLTAIAFRNKPDKEQSTRAQAQMLPAADHPAMLYAAPT